MTFSEKKNGINLIDKLVNKMDFFQRIGALCNKTDLVLKSFMQTVKKNYVCTCCGL